MSEILRGARLVRTTSGYSLQKLYPCINGLSAWFTLVSFVEPDEYEIGYTEGAIPSAKQIAEAICELESDSISDAVTAALIHGQYPISTEFDRGYDKGRKDAAEAIKRYANPKIRKGF